MILVHPKTAARRKWLVTCDVHGEITGTGQTTIHYGVAAAMAHADREQPGVACGGIAVIDRQADGRWAVRRSDRGGSIWTVVVTREGDAHARSLPAAIRKAHVLAAVDA